MSETYNAMLYTLSTTLPYVSSHLRVAVANQVGAIRRLTDEEPCRDPARAKQIIHQGTYRLLRLLGNLTNAELLGSEERFLRRNEDLIDWMDTCCRLSEALFATKGVSLTWDTPLRYKIIAFNSEKLEIAMYHLLSNALKFTPTGGSVRVTLRQAPGQVLLSVADTGCGISEEMMTIAFDRFMHPERIDGPDHGLGLGLAVSRQIAHRHGGRLLLDSREGKGTTVTLALPDERLSVDEVGENRFDYLGGFSHVHINLSDALPLEAFTDPYLDN